MSARPNLILILAHGMRSDALADARAWPLNTPHIEALSRRGLRLAAVSACPADPGAVVSLLTGLHPRQHGRTDDGDPVELTDALPLWLRGAGYHVGGVGCVGPVRWMLDDVVFTEDVCCMEPQGCDYWEAAESGGVAAAIGQQRRQRQRGGPFEPDRLMLDPDQDIDGYIGNQASLMLGRMPADRPWALLVIFSGPGNDLPPPSPYDGLVEPSRLHGGFVPLDPKRIDALADPVHPRAVLQRLEPHAVARIRADYLGRVSLIDYATRRLVETSDQREDRTRTWTMFTSERGHLLGEHGLVGHRSFLSGAVEVPLLIAPPRGAPMPDDPFPDGLFSTVDVAATAAALAGADVPPQVTGQSLLPLINGDPTARCRGGILSEFNDRLMLLTRRYKAVFRHGVGRCTGVYDLLHDREERENLIDTPVGQNQLESIRGRLADTLIPLCAARVD